jgi:signal transduction histidine kinase
MIFSFQFWLLVSAATLLIFGSVFYYTAFQKRRCESYCSILEGMVDIFTRDVYRDFPLFVKKMHNVLKVPAVFFCEYSESNALDLHAVIDPGTLIKAVSVDLTLTPFSLTKDYSLFKISAADCEFLKLLNQTGTPFIQIMPLVLSNGVIMGLIGIVYNKKPHESIFVKQILRLCASGIVSEYERDINERKNAYRLEQATLARKMDSMCMMARNVSHDMNNQLNAVLGYSDLLYKKIPPDAQLEKYLEGVISSARIGVDLTDKLMIFARRGKNVNVNVAVHNLIENAAAEVLLSRLVTGLTISTSLNAVDTNVKGDPTLLKIMLNNLISNAIDAMPQGGKISFITENLFFDDNVVIGKNKHLEFANGKYISISVCDEGIGMSANVKDHLFEPFFTTKKDKKNAGLGLATVWGSVKNHDGYIDVRSKKGSGSTFTVYLPVNQ